MHECEWHTSCGQWARAGPNWSSGERTRGQGGTGRRRQRCRFEWRDAWCRLRRHDMDFGRRSNRRQCSDGCVRREIERTGVIGAIARDLLPIIWRVRRIATMMAMLLRQRRGVMMHRAIRFRDARVPMFATPTHTERASGERSKVDTHRRQRDSKQMLAETLHGSRLDPSGPFSESPSLGHG